MSEKVIYGQLLARHASGRRANQLLRRLLPVPGTLALRPQGFLDQMRMVVERPQGVDRGDAARPTPSEVWAAQTEKVVEFFFAREAPEAMIGEVREDEPALAEELRVEAIELHADPVH